MQEEQGIDFGLITGVIKLQQVASESKIVDVAVCMASKQKELPKCLHFASTFFPRTSKTSVIEKQQYYYEV